MAKCIMGNQQTNTVGKPSTATVWPKRATVWPKRATGLLIATTVRPSENRKKTIINSGSNCCFSVEELLLTVQHELLG